MSIEEAIGHCEEVAEEQDKLCKRYDDASGYTRSHNEEIRTSNAKRCEECAADNRQLAEWLRDYKRLKEQGGATISRQVVLEVLKDKWNAFSDANDAMQESIDTIEALPPVNPQRTGHWIEDTNGTYTDNHDTWECSQCGHVQILLEGTPKDNDYNYCPNCGAKMEEEE